MGNKRGRAISCLFYRDLYLSLIFSGLLPKDLFKRRWSLGEILLKKNYCHACHTKRFAVSFPLPSCCVSSLMMQSHRQSEFCANLMYHDSDPARRVTPPWNVYMAKFDPGWEGYPVWQTRLPALAGHPTYHVNVIKLKWDIIWTGGLLPPKQVTSPTWGPLTHVNEPLDCPCDLIWA